MTKEEKIKEVKEKGSFLALDVMLGLIEEGIPINEPYYRYKVMEAYEEAGKKYGPSKMKNRVRFALSIVKSQFADIEISKTWL